MTSKKKLDTYLTEIYKSYIAIKDEDYERSLKVFEEIFRTVKITMGKQSEYFKHYCTQVMYAGSVYDKIKITKLDEFDMDLIVRLPTKNNKHLIVEAEKPGFVRLKLGEAFGTLENQKHWDKCHDTTKQWRDEEGYLLQNKFRHWVHSVVQKALNELNYTVTIAGVSYDVRYKEKGPAYTLLIQNIAGDPDIKFEVDLVPVLRFQYNNKWPDELFRKVKLPKNMQADWHAVPKPNKSENEDTVKNRAWRTSFQEIERFMMKNHQHLKPTIKLVKKLRDNLGLNEIASYYIKTLFLWKIHEEEADYWAKCLSDVFRVMVEELYNCIKERRITYFWHEGNNLLEHVPSNVLAQYAEKLEVVVGCLYYNDAQRIATFLLSIEELIAFRSSPFYQKQTKLNSLQRSRPIIKISSDGDQQENYTTVINTLDKLKEKLNSANGKVKVQKEWSKIAEELKRLNLIDNEQRKTNDNADSNIETLVQSSDPIEIPNKRGQRILSIDDEIYCPKPCHHNVLCYETHYENEWQNEMCSSTTNLFIVNEDSGSHYSTASEDETAEETTDENKINTKNESSNPKRKFNWKKVFSFKNGSLGKIRVMRSTGVESNAACNA